MKYICNFQYLVILFLMMSCVGQTAEQRENSSHHLQITEMQEREEPKLAPSGMEDKGYIPGEILVKFKDGTDEKTIQAIQGELQLETIRLVSRPNLYLMKILDGSSDETVMQRLRNYEGVILSEQNYVVTIY